MNNKKHLLYFDKESSNECKESNKRYKLGVVVDDNLILSPISVLPLCILVYVLSKTDYNTMASSRMVNKNWRKAANINFDKLRKIYLQDFRDYQKKRNVFAFCSENL